MTATATRTSKQQFCTCITLFCTILCRHCMTTTWKCLISRYTQEVHKRRRISSLFLNLDIILRNSTLRVRLQLTKLVAWSNRSEDWKNANSLFQRRFVFRRRPRMLRPLYFAGNQRNVGCFLRPGFLLFRCLFCNADLTMWSIRQHYVQAKILILFSNFAV